MYYLQNYPYKNILIYFFFLSLFLSFQHCFGAPVCQYWDYTLQVCVQYAMTESDGY